MQKKYCERCRTIKYLDEFYTHTQNYNIFYFTKDCCDCIRQIKSNNINDFIQYCQQLDIPIVINEWNKIIKRFPDANNPFGRYQSMMQLKGWMSYKFDDTNFLNSFNKEYID